jgi:glycosyl hydrolase family 99
MHTGCRQGVIALALGAFGVSAAVRAPDPVEQLARVRLVVTTQAAAVAITVDGATIASYISSVLDGPPAVTLSRTGRTLQLSRNVPGQSAEARFDIILADAAPGTAIAWNLMAASSAETQVEVYALSDLNHATLVDRFVSGATSAQFTSSSDLLVAPGRVRVLPFRPRLVLAHYYPWYTTETWRDPQMADRPPRLYSTEAQTDVNIQVIQAASAGIDAFVVSWQGLEAQGGFNDRRMRIVLEAARSTRLRVCAYTETYVANPDNNPNAPTDPKTMFEWLADLVDLYGSHPAYLRVDGRPVIFIYLAPRLSEADWTEIIARLRSTGRNPFLVGDFVRSTLLEPFDGEYQYTNVFSSGASLVDVNRTESLRVRTYSLLRQGDRRRLWVAPVTPGFDDSRLVDRVPPHVVDRSNGSVYDQQWTTAIDTGADWIVVTSWNEWWENTHVEASERYGTTYLERTRAWANAFKASSLDAPVPER